MYGMRWGEKKEWNCWLSIIHYGKKKISKLFNRQRDSETTRCTVLRLDMVLVNCAATPKSPVQIVNTRCNKCLNYYANLSERTIIWQLHTKQNKNRKIPFTWSDQSPNIIQLKKMKKEKKVQNYLILRRHLWLQRFRKELTQLDLSLFSQQDITTFDISVYLENWVQIRQTLHHARSV